ncbi:MAG: class I SAM-dependent methyltransferase, partial [Fibrobacteres bacterium]|nr:class I SAM-dependent methyltransferase [Fibrobacterota bacterium]
MGKTEEELVSNDKKLPCPCCLYAGDCVVEWPFSGIGDSVFNYRAEFFRCASCGLVWIGNKSDEELSKFYTQECSYFENSHFDISAPANVEKFRFYSSLLNRDAVECSSMVDVGCGRGGFIRWLAENNSRINGVGVDVDVKSLPLNTSGGFPKFIEGFATCLPFEDSTQELLTYFHVVEHIVDVNRVIGEAKRVLKDGGKLVIEVPDASRYNQIPISNGFWYSIREHIYHYSPLSIVRLLEKNGFRIVSVNQQILPTPEFRYSSLIVVAEKGLVKNVVNESADNSSFEFLLKSKNDISERVKELQIISSDYDKFVLWGVSNQLLTVLPVLELPISKIVICDSSKEKQKFTYRGVSICAPAESDKKNSL